MSIHGNSNTMDVTAEIYTGHVSPTDHVIYHQDTHSAQPSQPGDDEPDRFCQDVVAKFIEQLNSQQDAEPFMPYQEYLQVAPELANAPLAGFFWHNAGPSKKTNRVCWSWRYLSGCALIMNHHYPKEAAIKFSKQDRSEWAKVARFVNTVVSRIAPRASQLSYLMLDVLAVNSGLCRSLRKLPRQKAYDAAIKIANAINAMHIAPSARVTNSMGVLRIFQVLTRHNIDQLSSVIGLPIPAVLLATYPMSGPTAQVSNLLPTISVGSQAPGASTDTITMPDMAMQPLPDSEHLLVPHYWDHTHDPNYYAPTYQHSGHWGSTHQQDLEPFMANHWPMQEYTPSNASEAGNSSISATSSEHVDSRRNTATSESGTGQMWPTSWPGQT